MTKIIQKLQDSNSKKLFSDAGINYLGLFGSFARGEEKKDSDIDLLIDFSDRKKQSLFDLARVKIALQDILNREIDLSLRGNLKKAYEPFIMNDLITLYEKN